MREENWGNFSVWSSVKWWKSVIFRGPRRDSAAVAAGNCCGPSVFWRSRGGGPGRLISGVKASRQRGNWGEGPIRGRPELNVLGHQDSIPGIGHADCGSSGEAHDQQKALRFEFAPLFQRGVLGACRMWRVDCQRLGIVVTDRGPP
ncbi:MAG TPA: hypothetical protein DC058_08250 [Planctomycetaceae bacterium]|nr:hypothetical protein [Planctomycetaceae bacterium]HBC61197.1 hypothetical protein [Planctomycetaceae bacterium]